MTQAIVARSEIDCAKCKRRIRVNVHRVESAVILVNFALIVGLAALAYWLESQPLMLATFGVIMIGALVLPVLERTYLRDWPRYASLAGPEQT